MSNDTSLAPCMRCNPQQVVREAQNTLIEVVRHAYSRSRAIAQLVGISAQVDGDRHVVEAPGSVIVNTDAGSPSVDSYTALPHPL